MVSTIWDGMQLYSSLLLPWSRPIPLTCRHYTPGPVSSHIPGVLVYNYLYSNFLVLSHPNSIPSFQVHFIPSFHFFSHRTVPSHQYHIRSLFSWPFWVTVQTHIVVADCWLLQSSPGSYRKNLRLEGQKQQHKYIALYHTKINHCTAPTRPKRYLIHGPIPQPLSCFPRILRSPSLRQPLSNVGSGFWILAKQQLRLDNSDASAYS